MPRHANSGLPPSDTGLQGPLEPVYRAALALGTANQLTNILRDVGEDATQRNRIYVPLDELAQFGIGEQEVGGGGRRRGGGGGRRRGRGCVAAAGGKPWSWKFCTPSAWPSV